nr:MAG TPA: hypothetical protein [Caudoviricetes sp.]
MKKSFYGLFKSNCLILEASGIKFYFSESDFFVVFSL